MTEEETTVGLSQAPVNILFNPATISKKDVWEIDLIRILELLVQILEKSGKKDLRVAGMAVLSSSLIYRMKVESIFALQKAALEKSPLRKKLDFDINVIDLPYRHESTYPVTLDELLTLLENLIGSLANPRNRRSNQMNFEPLEAPNFQDYFIALENIIGKYEELILSKITSSSFGYLKDIIADLDTVDSIRCFFAILFLARDGKIDLEQEGDDIKITLLKGNLTR